VQPEPEIQPHHLGAHRLQATTHLSLLLRLSASRGGSSAPHGKDESCLHHISGNIICTDGAATVATTSPDAAPTYTPSNNGDKNKNKKRQPNDSNKIPTPATRNNVPLPLWSTLYNPWTSIVQAWPMPIWALLGPGLLGLCLGNASQLALTAT
jgi:hypothetical protein